MLTAKKARAQYERREKFELIGDHLYFAVMHIRCKIIEIRMTKFITSSVKKAVKEKRTSMMVWYNQPFSNQERRLVSTKYNTLELLKFDEICSPYTEVAFFQNIVLLGRLKKMGYSVRIVGEMKDNPQKRTQYQYELQW
jgi:hypothetical protein